MNSNSNIRLATTGDYPYLASLRLAYKACNGETWKSCPADFSNYFERFLSEQIEAGKLQVWVYTENNIILGTTYVFINKMENDDKQMGYLTGVYTIPSHRNRGIATALMTEVQNYCEDMDIVFDISWMRSKISNFRESLQA